MKDSYSAYQYQQQANPLVQKLSPPPVSPRNDRPSEYVGTILESLLRRRKLPNGYGDYKPNLLSSLTATKNISNIPFTVATSNPQPTMDCTQTSSRYSASSIHNAACAVEMHADLEVFQNDTCYNVTHVNNNYILSDKTSMQDTSQQSNTNYVGLNQEIMLETEQKGPGRKRSRQTYTISQIRILDDEYKKNSYVAKKDRSVIAYVTNLTERQVKTWFQNRRMKAKKEGTLIINKNNHNSPRSETCTTTSTLSPSSTEMPSPPIIVPNDQYSAIPQEQQQLNLQQNQLQNQPQQQLNLQTQHHQLPIQEQLNLQQIQLQNQQPQQQLNHQQHHTQHHQLPNQQPQQQQLNLQQNQLQNQQLQQHQLNLQLNHQQHHIQHHQLPNQQQLNLQQNQMQNQQPQQQLNHQPQQQLNQQQQQQLNRQQQQQLNQQQQQQLNQQQHQLQHYQMPNYQQYQSLQHQMPNQQQPQIRHQLPCQQHHQLPNQQHHQLQNQRQLQIRNIREPCEIDENQLPNQQQCQQQQHQPLQMGNIRAPYEVINEYQRQCAQRMYINDLNFGIPQPQHGYHQQQQVHHQQQQHHRPYPQMPHQQQPLHPPFCNVNYQQHGYMQLQGAPMVQHSGS